MEKTLSLVKAVQRRLYRLALYQILFKIFAIAGFLALSGILIASIYNKGNFALVILSSSILLAAVTALLCGKNSLNFSKEQAAAEIDAALSTKQRVISLLEIQKSRGALNLNQPISEFLSEQLSETIRHTFPAAILPFKMSTREILITILASLAWALIFIWLFITPALSSALKDKNARALADLIEQNPDLPAQVKDNLRDLAEKIESKGLSSEVTKESLNNAQQSISEAKSSLSSSKDKTGDLVQAKSGKSLNQAATPSPTATPTSTPTTPNQNAKSEQNSSVDNQHTKATEPQEGDQSKAKQGQAENDAKNPQQGQQQKDQQGEDQQGEGQQQQQKDQQQNGQQGQEGKDPQSGADQAKQEQANQNQQGGEGQGEEGQGSEGQQEKQDQSGAGAGQGEEKAEDKEGKLGDKKESGAEQKQNQDQKNEDQKGGEKGGEKGEDPNNKDSKGKEGQQSGDQKQGSEQALDKAQKALEDLKKQSTGASDKGEGKEDQKDKENKEGKNPSAAGSKDKKQESQKNKEKPEGEEKGENGSDSTPKDSEKKIEKPTEKSGNKGEDRAEDKKTEKDDKQQQSQDGQNSSKRQSQLDREVKLKEAGEDQLGQEGAGLGDKAKFQEAEVKTNEQEKLDERFTGEDQGESDAKEVSVAPKTSLQELRLSKPETSKQQRDQPIPLEYEGVF